MFFHLQWPRNNSYNSGNSFGSVTRLLVIQIHPLGIVSINLNKRAYVWTQTCYHGNIYLCILVISSICVMWYEISWRKNKEQKKNMSQGTFWKKTNWNPTLHKQLHFTSPKPVVKIRKIATMSLVGHYHVFVKHFNTIRWRVEDLTWGYLWQVQAGSYLNWNQNLPILLCSSSKTVKEITQVTCSWTYFLFKTGEGRLFLLCGLEHCGFQSGYPTETPQGF